MISDITTSHYAAFLDMNAEFVHWLSPMDEARLEWVLKRAHYARQIDDCSGALIGYACDVNYPDHKNLNWLNAHLDDFFYVDRIIIAAKAQGRGIGGKLYADVESFARDRGHKWMACEVNTKPDNRGSHKFHERMGYSAFGEADYPAYDAAVRYYKKAL